MGNMATKIYCRHERKIQCTHICDGTRHDGSHKKSCHKQLAKNHGRDLPSGPGGRQRTRRPCAGHCCSSRTTNTNQCCSRCCLCCTDSAECSCSRSCRSQCGTCHCSQSNRSEWQTVY